MEDIQTKCPICGHPVTKVKESDHQYTGEQKCHNEFYVHRGDQLVKIKNPKGAWESTQEYLKG